jgi:hypothetical protein
MSRTIMAYDRQFTAHPISSIFVSVEKRSFIWTDKPWLSYAVFAAILVISFILHYPHLSKDLIGIHVWRQTQTQWNTLNFYRYDFNIFNPRTSTFNGEGSNIARFEFPLMQWLVALMMKIFGDAIIVTRLCYFTVGAFSVLGMYRILKLLTRNEVGSWMGAFAFCFSPVFFYYTINPLPDNAALCSGVWFLYYALRFMRTRDFRNVYYSALFLLLATLTKLPYIILSAGVGFYALRYARRREVYKMVTVYVIAILPAVAWYVWVIPGWGGNGVLYGIFRNEVPVSRYQEILDYHKTVMFPVYVLNKASMYLFFIGALFVLLYSRFRSMEFWVLAGSTAAVVAYWLLELNMIGIIHDYYMLPFLPPVFIVVGYACICMWRSNWTLKLLVVLFMIKLVMITYYTTRDEWSIERSYQNPDGFIYERDLRRAVPRDTLCLVGHGTNPFVPTYLVDKRGYFFENTFVRAVDMKNLIEQKHVRYLYCDTRGVDSAADIQPFLKRLIMQRGSYKVWELQSDTVAARP